ncbi:hypothetical protein FGG08_004973 [Glutinoglossum americanum]|uniref:C2H2 type master regulator of conidiophore development brlA n=1 Tax=Glutinoglossum americanum TaxID=1670608 RepID=A0A9P8KWH2_9PEZI|nr:hypothetical protein FGG08_004973 [Glutinoglossum americanum]
MADVNEMVKRVGMPPSIDTHGLNRYPFQSLPRQLPALFVPTPGYGETASIGLSTADSHNFLSTVTPNMLVLNQFSTPIVAEEGQRDCSAAVFSRGFLGAHERGGYQLRSYEHIAFASCKRETMNGGSSDISENDALDISITSGFDSTATVMPSAVYSTRSRVCAGLSSPATSNYTSPMHERASLTMLPSQQCPEPSTPQSAASMALPMSLWGNSPASTDDMLENISPFATPMVLSTPVSPTANADSNATSRAEFVLTSPTLTRANRAKVRNLQCNKHHGKHCNKDCGKLCRLPKIYSKEDNNHKCPKCDQRFKRQEHLKRHDRVHTRERPYECQVEKCRKRFSRSDNFKEHMRTHRKRGGRNDYVPELEV